jgi:glycosyltransferase involved in cell wall biosynthesis
MQSNPKVSIVIPCYNRERYLGLAIQSVLNQTYTDFELIIVDDGSTDASLQIAEQFASEDSRVKVIAQEQNQGVALTLKKGFDIAQGEFIGQVDSDDLLEPPALEITVQVLEGDPGLGMVYTNYIEINEEGERTRVGRRCQVPYSRERLLTSFMTFHFRLIRKSIYDKVGGIESGVNTFEDYDLCLKISEVSRIRRVNDFLYLYRQHSESISAKSSLERIALNVEVITEALSRRGLLETHRIRVANPEFFVEEIQGLNYFKNQP